MLLGYKGSIKSLENCGKNTGQFITKSCGCGQISIPLTPRCNNRACSICSKTRSRKIIRELLPLLSRYSTNPRDKKYLKFLTISPANYDSPENALEDIKSNLNKFLRKEYVKNRIDACIIVIETKTKNRFGEYKGWNFHIHIIYYGKRLDNQIRGYCRECHQNLIKFDEDTNQPYCANKNCNSKNVVVVKNSKLTNLWDEFSTRPAHFDIRPVYSYKGACNYLAKYVSANKNDFYYEKNIAEFIHYSRGKRLFIFRGEFAKYRYVKTPFICKHCGEPIKYSFDSGVSRILLDLRKPPDVYAAQTVIYLSDNGVLNMHSRPILSKKRILDKRTCVKCNSKFLISNMSHFGKKFICKHCKKLLENQKNI